MLDLTFECAAFPRWHNLENLSKIIDNDKQQWIFTPFTFISTLASDDHFSQRKDWKEFPLREVWYVLREPISFTGETH